MSGTLLPDAAALAAGAPTAAALWRREILATLRLAVPLVGFGDDVQHRALTLHPTQRKERCGNVVCRRATFLYGVPYEHDRLDPRLGQVQRRGKPGDAAADDGDRRGRVAGQARKRGAGRRRPGIGIGRRARVFGGRGERPEHGPGDLF